MPNTCTVYGCRSGYKPNKEEKEQRAKDEAEGKPFVSIPVHKFPVAHEDICNKWKQVLSSFMDISHINNFGKIGICKLHFKESDYESDILPNGDIRQRLRLKSCAVPTIFTVAPSYMQKNIEGRATVMAAPSLRLDSLRKKALEQEKQMLKDLCVDNLDELKAKLKDYRISTGFEQVMHKINDGESLLCFQNVQLVDKRPIVQTCLVIDTRMNFQAYILSETVKDTLFKDIVVKVRKNKMAMITRVDEVVNILSRLNDLKSNEVSELEKLETCLAQVLDSAQLNGEIESLVRMFQEQLKITKCAPKMRRYPVKLLMKCATWVRMGPKLYRELVSNSGLTLPTYGYIKRFQHFTKFRGDMDDVNVKYFQMRIDKLQDKEKVVHMAIDEVYTTQSLSLIGGTFFGETNGCLTRTLLSVHINSVAGSYEVKTLYIIPLLSLRYRIFLYSRCAYHE